MLLIAARLLAWKRGRMEFIQSEKVENLIHSYNSDIRQGALPDFNRLARQALLAVKCDEKACKAVESNKVLEVLNRWNYFEIFQKWLYQEKFTHVILQNIKCVFISTEILGEHFQNYSGFAQKIGDAYYIYVFYGEPVERTISILTHEVVHIVLEKVFRGYEAEKNMVIGSQIEEDIVIYAEHYISRKLFGMLREELSGKEKQEYLAFFSSDIKDGNFKEVIETLLSMKIKYDII